MAVSRLLTRIVLSVCLVCVAKANVDDYATFEDQQAFSKINDIYELCLRINNFMNASECEEVLSGPIDDGENNKTLVSQASTIALFDACNPREQTVALPRDPDPRITVWPICTRVKRCGGCCTSDVFTCSPTETKDKYVKVFKTLLPYPGAHTFQFLGVRIVRLEEHTQCDAQCRIKEHECHKYQVYEPRKCRCRCRQERLSLKKQCTENQIWDDDECNCICPTRSTVRCPEPSVFSETTCKCTLKTSVTGEIDLERLFEQLDQGFFGPNFQIGPVRDPDSTDIETNIETDLNELGEETGYYDDGESTPDAETTEPATTTPSTTTSTTTTPTTTTTTRKPIPTLPSCPFRPCPPGWKLKRMPNKRCMCMPPIPFGK